MAAPADQSLLALPPLVRQHDTRPVEAGVAVDEEDTAVPVEFRLQGGCKLEIARGMAVARDHFEEQSDHDALTVSAHQAGALVVKGPAGNQELHGDGIVARAKAMLFVERMRGRDPIAIDLDAEPGLLGHSDLAAL